MAHTNQKHAPRWTAPTEEASEKTSETEAISFSEHVVRVLVLGLAAAYTYILLS